MLVWLDQMISNNSDVISIDRGNSVNIERFSDFVLISFKIWICLFIYQYIYMSTYFEYLLLF